MKLYLVEVSINGETVAFRNELAAYTYAARHNAESGAAWGDDEFCGVEETTLDDTVVTDPGDLQPFWYVTLFHTDGPWGERPPVPHFIGYMRPSEVKWGRHNNPISRTFTVTAAKDDPQGAIDAAFAERAQG